jgi:hypothetical protein
MSVTNEIAGVSNETHFTSLFIIPQILAWSRSLMLVRAIPDVTSVAEPHRCQECQETVAMQSAMESAHATHTLG